MQLQITQENEEEYKDTRRWRFYEVVLLMKKNEIRKDRKHPLTTPEYASVRQSTMSSSKRFPSVHNSNRRDRNSFEEKRKRQKHFSFSIKEISILLLSYLFFNSKDMTLIPGVYIGILS